MQPIKKKILMIAYHYPPHVGGSGIHRIQCLQEHLTNEGWEVHMLTPHSRAYSTTQNISTTCIHHHSFALNTSKHLSIRGRYFKFMALPDNWISWWFSAVPVGLHLINKIKPDCIWSSYPIATTHLIALTLNKITKTPWVADFRDPMVDSTHPYDKQTRKIYQWIEKKSIDRCQQAIFTTNSTQNLYKQRYPQISHKKYHVIENGYNESSFTQPIPLITPSLRSQAISIVHSGHVYPIERNPTNLIQAIKHLLSQKLIDNGNFSLIFRGDNKNPFLEQLIKQHNLTQSTKLKGLIPHKEAINELYSHSALLILQASNCNHQIPAKTYEYLRTGKPILAVTDLKGDTAKLLQNFKHCYLSDINSQSSIEKMLLRFINDLHNAKISSPNVTNIEQLSRKLRAKEMENVLINAISKNN